MIYRVTGASPEMSKGRYVIRIARNDGIEIPYTVRDVCPKAAAEQAMGLYLQQFDTRKDTTKIASVRIASFTA